MKKVLFATSALVASAGIASAEIQGSSNITLSGSAQIGMAYTENTNNADKTSEFTTQSEAGLAVSMSSTTDGGLGFGATFSIDGDNGNNADANVFISGTFGRITVGNDTGRANAVASLPDFGFDGMGFDDIVEDFQETGGHDTRWSYTVGALTVGASADLNSNASVNSTTTASEDNAWGVGASYVVNDALTVAVGYTEATNANGFGTGDVADDSATSLGLSYTAGAVTVSLAGVAREDGTTETDAAGATIAYAIDSASTITVGYASAETAVAANDENGFAIGYTQNLGGGATFNAAYGSIDDSAQTDENGRAQVGLTFSF
jgi:outer membrane protein OmpU